MMRSIAVAAIFAFGVAASAGAETYQIDASHSTIGFRIRHLVGKVKGRFDTFEGTFDHVDGKPAAWKAAAVIEAASVNTANAKRDDHLRNPDFFNVEKCPKLEFVSKKVTEVKGNTAKLHGDLTMLCVTKPVVLDLEIGGVIKEKDGLRAGALASGKLSRKEFKLLYNKILEAGGVAIGDEVEIDVEIEGTAGKKG
ncbi:MAG: YceI family protein [Elusimicrobia bacterium]|nr:YceI family protein [Elusimicrobiota bacterium]